MLESCPLFINTILLGGPTDAKLHAAKAAGFASIELWRQDIESAVGGYDAVNHTLRETGLGLIDYQVLLDFDGAPGALREAKRQEAIAMLDMAVNIGAKTVLSPASTHVDCDSSRVVEDLRWFCDAAKERGVRIAYEAMGWSRLYDRTPAAWELIQKVDADNLGMVIDAFHIFVRGGTAADIKDIPAEKIFLVQLSDLHTIPARENLIDTARHHRLLPGEGAFPVHTVLEALEEKRYTGPLGLEVFNDEMKASNPDEVAVRAMKALRAVLGR